MSSIYVLGDSHTQALGPRIKTRFPEHTVVFEAFPGQGTNSARSKASIPFSQDLIVLSLGGNDFGDQSAARAALVRDLRARNPTADMVWFGPFQANDSAVDKRHLEQTLSQQKQLPALGVKFVDTRPISPAADHTVDQVHFTATGYTKLADAMKKTLDAALTGTSPESRFSAGVALLAAGALVWYLISGRRQDPAR